MHPKLVTRVHEQRLRVGRDGRQVGQLRAGRAGRHTVLLDEGEVRGLDAVEVAVVELAGALEVVDMEGGAPVGVVAADVVDERTKPGRVELYFEEGAPAAVDVESWGIFGCVRVAVRLAGRLRIGERVAQRHAEPGGD